LAKEHLLSMLLFILVTTLSELLVISKRSNSSLVYSKSRYGKRSNWCDSANLNALASTAAFHEKKPFEVKSKEMPHRIFNRDVYLDGTIIFNVVIIVFSVVISFLLLLQIEDVTSEFLIVSTQNGHCLLCYIG
jgi:hypothetical protein